MVGTIASSLFLIKAGKMYDKLGVRIIAGTVAIGMGLALIGLSFADVAVRNISISFISPAYIAVGILIIGFFALRFCGQGVLTMVSRNMIAKWFVRKRGLVVGITGIFISFGFSTSPKLLDVLIGKVGWRMTWILCAIVAGFLFSIIVFVFYRDNPEECGLVPDGSLADEKKKSIHSVKKQFTLADARKNFAFWIFSLSLAMCALYITAVTFHIASVFSSAGLSSKEAFMIFIPSSFISIAVRLVGGWISDKIKLKYLLSAFILGMIISITGMILLDGGKIPLWSLIFGNGMMSGLFALILSIAWPTYFGRKHLGAISGLNMTIIIFFSAIGPWIFSESLALSNSYRPAGYLCLTVVLILFVLSFKADNPQLKIADEE
jgi:MFS family permease